jgi:hypothetical protein
MKKYTMAGMRMVVRKSDHRAGKREIKRLGFPVRAPVEYAFWGLVSRHPLYPPKVYAGTYVCDVDERDELSWAEKNDAYSPWATEDHDL